MSYAYTNPQNFIYTRSSGGINALPSLTIKAPLLVLFYLFTLHYIFNLKITK